MAGVPTFVMITSIPFVKTDLDQPFLCFYIQELSQQYLRVASEISEIYMQGTTQTYQTRLQNDLFVVMPTRTGGFVFDWFG